MSELATTYWNELRPSAAGHADLVLAPGNSGAGPRRPRRDKRQTRRVKSTQPSRDA
jgi:hypothetical protein